MNLLIHTCCSACAMAVLDQLPVGFSPVLYFYNPNIHPYREFQKRLDSFKVLINEDNLSAYSETGYNPEIFLNRITGREKNRCDVCYSLRLSASAGFAKEIEADAFTTTLLCSPYQDLDLIKATGEDVAIRHKIPFYYQDFKPGFRKAHETAKIRGLYLQGYCGCIYSEKERYYKKK